MALYTVTFNDEEFEKIRDLLGPLDKFSRLFVSGSDTRAEFRPLVPGEILDTKVWLNVWEADEGLWRMSITNYKGTAPKSMRSAHRHISVRELFDLAEHVDESSDLRPG